MLWIGWTGWVAAALTLVCACSSDDGGAFAGVARWKCFADAASGDCDCHGLEAGSDVDAVGSDLSEVSSCTGYTRCATYRDDFGDWMCSCGDESYAPPAGSTEVSDASACPP